MQNPLKQIPIPVILVVIFVSTIAGVFGAVFVSPWFSWFDNALSDLGVYGNGLPAAIMFNFGLMVGGLTTLLLALRIYGLCSHSPIEQLGSVVLVLVGLSLFAIGFFPETVMPIHFIVAIAFFMLLPVASFLFGFKVAREKSNMVFAIYSFILPLVSVVAWVPPYYTGWAIPEIISSIAGWMWIILLGLHYNKKAENKTAD